jgi:hypothetical protein
MLALPHTQTYCPLLFQLSLKSQQPAKGLLDHNISRLTAYYGLAWKPHFATVITTLYGNQHLLLWSADLLPWLPSNISYHDNKVNTFITA